MGYRHHLGILDKEKHEIIKDMTYEELQKHYNSNHVSCYDITNEIYELGKYYNDEFLRPFKSNVFTDPATNREYNQDSDFFIISKEGFEAIIDAYRNNIKEYYEKLLKQDNEDLLMGRIPTIDNAIRNKINTWGENCIKFKFYPYELKGERISTAWDYEYAIFELVRIYKSIDWDKQLLTITAW